jgi:integrase
MTLTQTFNEMLDMQVSYSYHTVVCKKSAFKKHIAPIIGGLDINEITYPQLQNLLNNMLKTGYMPKTVSHIRDILTTSFDYAERIGLLSGKNFARLLQLKKIDNRAFLRLSKSECVAFVSAVKNEPNLFWRGFFIFLLSGRRLNEAKSLQWSWIDFDSLSVCVPAISSKDRYSHSYALTPELAYILKQLPRTSSLVFPSPATGLKLQDVRKAFAKILDRAGIDNKKMRIHDIRHLVATVSLNAGMSLEDVKYALGHNSLQTTMRYITNDVSKSKKVSSFILNISISGL